MSNLLKLELLPWLPLDERSRLPDMPAVYFCVDSSNTIQYIGSSNSLKKRFVSHHRMYDLARLNPIKVYFQLINPDHIGILTQLERMYIERVKPSLNCNQIQKTSV